MINGATRLCYGVATYEIYLIKKRISFLSISVYLSTCLSISLTIASTILGVSLKGTISGLFRDSPLSNRQSKSQLMFSALMVSMRMFSVWRSPRPVRGKEVKKEKRSGEGR